MAASRHKFRRWLMLGFGLPVLALFSLSAWRWYCVAAVQDAVERGWEITFDKQERPHGMPALLDECLYDLLEEHEKSFATQIPQVIYTERLRSIFRGSLREIHIYYFISFRGNLGLALRRFPHLKRVTVMDNEAGIPTASQWKELCVHLRQMTEIEELELGGAEITTGALAPLAGHPTLQKLTLDDSRITPEIVQTLATIPNLRQLEVQEVWEDREGWTSRERQIEISAALPGVKVLLRVKE